MIYCASLFLETNGIDFFSNNIGLVLGKVDIFKYMRAHPRLEKAMKKKLIERILEGSKVLLATGS